MIHFQHPQILWLLLLIPVFVGVWIWLQYRNKKRLEEFADRGMFGRLIPDASTWRPATKFGLIMLAAAFLIIAIANPQEGSKMVKGERLGSDIAICLDISNSMMAEDIQPNRLERSKRTVANLLNALGSDRISLVVFAGSSYVQMPLTSDYSAVKLFLDQIDCSLISAQGTAIGDAIDKAMETFGYGDPDREWVKNQGRAIVVISDGENFEDDAEAAARKAAAQNVRVCTIGMGLPEGTPIPEYRGSQRVGYKRDNSGNTVTTHLDEATLTAIAHAGKGIYVRANNINSGIQDIVKLIEGLEKDSFGETLFSEYESRYQYPLVAALLCLIAELLIFERRNKKFNLDKIMKRSLPILFLIFLMLPSLSVAQNSQARKDTRKGNREYKANHFDRAEVDYRRALHYDSTAYRAHYNLGNTLYRQKKYEEAAQHYSQALEHPGLDKKTRSRLFHNRGNSNLKAGLQKENRAEGMQQFQQAVNDYQESLKINPKNDDTRYNLSYAKKLLQQAQQQQQQNGGGQGDNQDQKDKNKDKNKDGNNGQDKQQDQQNKQDQQQNQQNQQDKKQDRQKQKQQQQRQEQKKQDAERLLEAVKNNEKNTMKENAKKLEVAPAGRIEKDW